MPADINTAIDEAVRIFQTDLVTYEARVNKAISAPLEQHEFDALVSFDFNTGGIHRAQLKRAINRGDKRAARHFMGWLRPPEIRKRRTAEMNLFKTGDYDANGDTIPVWRVDGTGRLRGILKSISGEELVERLGHKPPSVFAPPSPQADPQNNQIPRSAFTAFLDALQALINKIRKEIL